MLARAADSPPGVGSDSSPTGPSARFRARREPSRPFQPGLGRSPLSGPAGSSSGSEADARSGCSAGTQRHLVVMISPIIISPTPMPMFQYPMPGTGYTVSVM